MPADDELERRIDAVRAAREAVQAHLSSAVRVWRNDPSTEPLVPITEAWIDEHEALKESVEDAERLLIERMRGRG